MGQVKMKLWISSGVSIVAGILMALAAPPWGWFVLAWISERVAADLRNQTYSHLQRLSLEFFGGKRTGDLIVWFSLLVSAAIFVQSARWRVREGAAPRLNS